MALHRIDKAPAYAGSTRRAGHVRPPVPHLGASYLPDPPRGWITVAGDPDFRMQLAGRIENGRDGISDPALGRPT